MLPYIIVGGLGVLIGLVVADQCYRGEIHALEEERDRALAEADMHADNARLFAASACDFRSKEEIEAMRRMLTEDEPDPADWWKTS